MTVATPFVIIGVLFVVVAIMGALDHFSTADRSAGDEPGRGIHPNASEGRSEDGGLRCRQLCNRSTYYVDRIK